MGQIKQCGICGKSLTGRLDTFGPVGAELCEACHCEMEREIDAHYRIIDAGRIPCPRCGKLMVESAEPDLWHCWDCHLWVDKRHDEMWAFRRGESGQNPRNNLLSRIVALANRLALEVAKARQ